MTATVTDIRYRKGFEPVSIVVVTPFGSVTLQTTQSALNARAESGTWDDPEVDALAQDTLNDLFPGAGVVVA